MNQLFKNTLVGFLRSVFLIPIFFIIVPFTISKIGLENYGIWSLTGVILTYQSFIDFGINTSMIKFIAEANVTNKKDLIADYLAVGLVIFTILPLLLTILIFIFSEYLAIAILNIKSNLPDAVFVIQLSSLSIIINLLSSLFKSTIDGLQRMDISNIILFCQVLISSLGIFIFLSLDYGLRGLAINLLLVNSLVLVVNIILVKKLLPEVRLNPFLFKINIFKKIFAYSLSLQLSSLVRIWVEPLNKILISHYFSVQYVGYYDIGIKFTTQINSLVNSGLQSIFPASAAAFARDGLEKIESFRKKIFNYVLPTSTIIYFTIFLIAPYFIGLWLGDKMVVVSDLVRILLIAQFIISLSIPCNTILNGIGYAVENLKAQILSVILNIIALVSIYWIGFLGIPVAYLVSVFGASILMHYYYFKKVKSDNTFIKELLNIKIFIPVIAVNIVMFFLLNFFTIDNITQLIIITLIDVCISIALLIFLKVITMEWVEILFGPGVFNKLKNIFLRLKFIFIR